MLKGIYQIRKGNVLEIVKFVKRKELADKIGMDVGLLNQYLRNKNPKNFGQDVITRITTALNVPDGYLDHEHQPSDIEFIFSKDSATKSDVFNNKQPITPNQTPENRFKILKVMMGLEIDKENKLEVTQHISETSSVHYPDNMRSPLAFLIIGNTKRIPYKDGWVVIAEQGAEAVQGEEALIFLKNEKVFAGEILLVKENFIEYENAFGERDSVKRDDVSRILPIKIYIAPSQKIKN